MGQGTSNPDGKNGKHWSYFGENGWLRTGWQQMGQGTSNPDGKNSKHWSYFGPNGWIRTGMQTMGTSTNPDGKCKQHLSYFGGNGWLADNKAFTYNKVQYIADSRGWLTQVKSEYDKTLVRAHQLVAKITNNSMKKKKKLRVCYDYFLKNYFDVRPRTPHYSGQGWHIIYANDIFNNKKGNCYSYASAFAFTAKAIGYDNVYAAHGAQHGWAEINGLVYDPGWEKYHKDSCFGIKYDTNRANDYKDYKKIFSLSNKYARVKI